LGDNRISTVQTFRSILESAEVLAALDKLKILRDKGIAHNEVAHFVGPTWDSLKTLIFHAQNFVGVVGWAFYNTVYVHEGEYFLSSDAQRPSKAMARLAKKLNQNAV